MEINIDSTILSVKSENPFLTSHELQKFMEWLKSNETVLEAAKYLGEYEKLIIDNTIQSLKQSHPDLFSTSQMEEKITGDISFYLHLIRDSLVVSDKTALGEALKPNILDTLSLSPSCLIESLNLIKNNIFLQKDAKEEILEYINYAIQKIIEKDKSKNLEDENDQAPFWKKIIEIGTTVSQAEWEKLPKDFSKNFEHYLYGVAKDS
jgi:Phycobilisome protein